VSLDRVVGEIIKDVRADIERAGAEVAVRGPLGYVEGHRETVSVAIRNLLTNAIKFVSDGQRPRVDVSTARAGGRLRLSIRDNGIGVPASEQTRIFTPFERLHANAVYPGTGLGLAIVAAAIRSLGGEVGVESDGRTGSCYWIELPESAHGEDARGDANTAR
jgi:signal transduction histidine kinase